ncbi:carboxylesterase/lipase family protein [Microbacterium sp. P04]|uniref:carboxylesterase/lipase family protein n=1 Tax=Microbacterium sp. P04 TaxID=3366947 RepID=UPI0037462F2C
MTDRTAPPVVQTQRGAVRGFHRGDTAVFLGIPFAQPPVGALRFAAPEPMPPWEGVRDATSYGATAQRGDTGVTLIPEPSVPGDATLNVNVFTPRTRGGRALPVIVYIHGGGYISGSPASRWYDGDAFARDGVVTVVISYRLGFDGFGVIEGAPDNRAVLDWLAALEWVREEVSSFGGDPARVTLVGQSAGGGAVLTLLGMPAAQGLFAAALAISPALVDVPRARAEGFSRRLAELAGVAPTRAGFASVPEERLTALQDAASRPVRGGPLAALTAVLDDGLPWAPLIDGELIAAPTLERIADGVGRSIPLVLGTADDEFTMTTDKARGILRFVPASFALGRLGLDAARRRAYLADNVAQHRLGTAAVLGRYASDRVFRAGIPRVAAARGDAPTWVYRFAWRSPVIGWACHCLDVPFWFDHLDAEGVSAIAGQAPPASLAREMHAAVVRIATVGDPGWPAWTTHPGRTRLLGAAASEPPILDDGYREVTALSGVVVP